MRIRVRLFGHLAEAARRSEVVVDIDGGTAGDALEAVRKAHPLLKLGGVKLAVNDEYAKPARPLKSNDVLSLLPPVGGG